MARLQDVNSDTATWGMICSSHAHMIELSELTARTVRAQSAAFYSFMNSVALRVGSLLRPASHTDLVAAPHFGLLSGSAQTLIACAEPRHPPQPRGVSPLAAWSGHGSPCD